MITTVTLNASIDKAYHMKEEIEYGKVMRVSSCHNSAGGKGLNVARIVKLCGSNVITTGFVGGFNGLYLEDLLDNDNIPHNFFHAESETRSCINILDKKYGSTEFLESGRTILDKEVKAFLEDTYLQSIENSSVVTLSGSVPSGLGEDIYLQMINIAKAHGKKVILDTSGDFLKEGIKAGPTMIKPNKDEIENLFGVKLKSIEDVKKYGLKLHQMGIPIVVISLGSKGAMMVCDEGIFISSSPKLSVVNTVGCGDSMVGAFAVAMEKGFDLRKSLKYAVSVASANAMSLNTGDFDIKCQKEIYENTSIEKM
ncbi:MAG: 1-phosphofructokinase family hexose kinase [Lachnospiraceae bacterium]|jgi:tagatose 6-phosphate kinase|nr:1-phosphofructokinase family hexose kinase [Lachnospiraceae bacterium]